eukprot:TRINITY_DN5777_c0_g1::TRINITY_DN5777_c0_g1_i1::g.14554::m.14554 TRINITY_DN5777_c0_g1::TRINITY_DN5777_c0_g1_i1::g.14554  ORF type:complete len:546 (-),score=-2.09,sp/Q7T163/KDIS_DANRE/26.53/3e-15,Ank_2/PF12796.2/0.00021,Ank_2/PF12796.2/2.3e-13,Ank_2/PF12796.2/1.8e-08,Ank_2/PF12796.2/5.7e+03,Ank_3/PF13606.1/1.5e+04,Ank_3/PF13606.1/31,Ank_3/PF13606.1/2e+03,Ank_3/PF13606.1/11,Ank_3/PF13606.1/4.7e-05,Ank_3/PF13606.1/0.057,Ank_3/PF13606.1/0.19,Ank_3/PF13606.1/0.00046,Ank_3/PF13606.1/1.1e+03,Ank/PF0002
MNLNAKSSLISLLLSHLENDDVRLTYIMDTAVQTSQTALRIATENDNAFFVSALLDAISPHHRLAVVCQKDHFGDNAVILAAMKASHQIVATILEHLPFDDARHTCIFSKGYDDTTMLFEAAALGHASLVSLILKNLPNPELIQRAIFMVRRYGETPLFLAARNGHTSIISMLLDALPRDAHCAYILHEAENHFTALMEAAKHGHVTVIHQLLSALPTPEIRCQYILPNRNESALNEAAKKGHCEVISALLNLLPTPELRQRCIMFHRLGYTPIMHAARNGYCDVVQTLIEALPDPTIRMQYVTFRANITAVNAFEVAVQGGRLPLAGILRLLLEFPPNLNPFLRPGVRGDSPYLRQLFRQLLGFEVCFMPKQEFFALLRVLTELAIRAPVKKFLTRWIHETSWKRDSSQEQILLQWLHVLEITCECDFSSLDPTVALFPELLNFLSILIAYSSADHDYDFTCTLTHSDLFWSQEYPSLLHFFPLSFLTDLRVWGLLQCQSNIVSLDLLDPYISSHPNYTNPELIWACAPSSPLFPYFLEPHMQA